MNQKLKTLRIANGYTQVQIAENLSITDRCYQRYEAGKRIPDAKTAIQLAKILNTTVEYLFTS